MLDNFMSTGLLFLGLMGCMFVLGIIVGAMYTDNKYKKVKN